LGTIPRASTGVLGFDELIEGGLPVGSVMLLAGPPGAGKTTFSAKFLFEGATMLGEKGVYVCFAETKDSLVRSMLRFGWDFDRLDREQRCIILDLSTAKEAGIQKNLDEILGAISSLGAKRLVIDSFTAFTMALKEPINIRHLIHLLYRFLKNLGCTTIIVTDTPWSSERIGSGVEEFIADSIILMQSRFNEKRQLERTLRILKMRSTDHSQKVHDYKITSKGIEILP
jgi:circadian clock protein KaiC